MFLEERGGEAQIPQTVCWNTAPWAGVDRTVFELQQQHNNRHISGKIIYPKGRSQSVGPSRMLGFPETCSISVVQQLATKTQVIFSPSAPEEAPGDLG